MWYLFVWLLVVLLLICIHKADNVCVDVFVDIDTCQLNSTTPFVVVAFALTLLLLNDVVYLLFGFKPPTHTSKLLNKLRQKKKLRYTAGFFSPPVLLQIPASVYLIWYTIWRLCVASDSITPWAKKLLQIWDYCVEKRISINKTTSCFFLLRLLGWLSIVYPYCI